MKKKKIFLALAITIITTLSAMGCAGGNGSNPAGEAVEPENSISGDVVVSANEVVSADTIVSEDTVISANETVSADEISLDSEDSVDAEEEYCINEENIINLEEAFSNWSDIFDIQREINMDVSYVDCDVPTQLQDMVIYASDGIADERDEYLKEYYVDCETITEENKDNYPIEDILLDEHNYTHLHVVDIDGDGENEYFHHVANGDSGWSYLCFHKNVEGTWIDITVGNSEYGNAIVSYEGRYYIWTVGSVLRWWNDEIETPKPNEALIDGNPCWHSLGFSTCPTEYTPYELYSNTETGTINFPDYDFLETINLNCLEFKDNDEGDMVVSDVAYTRWGTESVIITPQYCWEIENEGQQYLCIVTERYSYHAYHYYESWDRQLVIMRQTEEGAWEIVKVYYLMAGFERSLG